MSRQAQQQVRWLDERRSRECVYGKWNGWQQQAVNNGGAAALQQASGGHYLGTILVA